MSSDPVETFGTDSQRALQRRAWDLWALVGDDPRFFTHGRAVQTDGGSLDTLPLQIALARLQGVGPADAVPVDQLDARCAALQNAGLQTDSYIAWQGDAAAFDAAENVLTSRALPDDLTLHHVGRQTDAGTMAALDALTQSCDVLLPMGPFIRGEARPATCVYLTDPKGKPVAIAAAIIQHGPDHELANLAWWGMLATDPSRRGQGLALILGARAMLDMAERHGITHIRTGIRQGNAPSEALCAKLGLAPTETADVIAIYPPAFDAGQMTK